MLLLCVVCWSLIGVCRLCYYCVSFVACGLSVVSLCRDVDCYALFVVFVC